MLYLEIHLVVSDRYRSLPMIHHYQWSPGAALPISVKGMLSCLYAHCPWHYLRSYAKKVSKKILWLFEFWHFFCIGSYVVFNNNSHLNTAFEFCKNLLFGHYLKIVILWSYEHLFETKAFLQALRFGAISKPHNKAQLCKILQKTV